MSKRPPRDGSVRIENRNTLLIDASSLFKTSFYGAKNEFNSEGIHIGGLYQFLTVFRKLLSEELYHRVYVFWDGKFSGKLRYDIYPPYKSGRGKDYINGTKPIDESELNQLKLVWEYLNELCVRQIRHNVVEADDFIGYYCLTKKDNETITILSSDRDFSQLISDDIKIYFCDLKTYVGIDNYSSYFCHHQSNSVLIKTILGDNSDSIKGIKGIKEGKLLSFFPELKEKKLSLEDIINKSISLQKERIDKKQKPLQVFDNIINGVTDGVQGNKIYEINSRLVNLKTPMMTEDAIQELEQLKEGFFSDCKSDFKNVLSFMKRDGLDKTIGEYRYPDYLVPFKKLLERELKESNKKIENYEQKN